MITEQYLWVSIEGTDAVGKSNLLQEMRRQLEAASHEFLAVFLDEFSDSPVGDVIRNIIRYHRFFIIGNDHHPLAETAVLYADYLYQFESIFQRHPAQKILFVSDRGPYSFFTYQRLRIEKSHPHLTVTEIEMWIRSLFTPIGFPHVNLLLVSPVEQILQRLANREGAPNDEELRFIERVQETYTEIFSRERQAGKPGLLVIDSLDGNLNEVTTTAMQAVHEALVHNGWTA